MHTELYTAHALIIHCCMSSFVRECLVKFSRHAPSEILPVQCCGGAFREFVGSRFIRTAGVCRWFRTDDALRPETCFQCRYIQFRDFAVRELNVK